MFMTCCSLRSFRPLTLVLCAWASCLCVTGHARPAAAQAAGAAPQYQWDTIAPEYADAKALVKPKGDKDAVMTGRDSFSSSRALLESWYRSYLFPSMATPDQLGELYEKRESLAKDMEMAAERAEPAVHQYLLDLAYEEATRRATGNYHPFVRYNAMLIIGNLNQTEASLVNGVRYPAVRLPKALDFLVDEFTKPDQIDVVKLAAMIGIQRHFFLVRYRPADQPIPDARKAEIAGLLKALLDEKTVPAGRSPGMHVWLRRTAADVLGTLGSVGDNHAIFDSLARVVSDADEPLSLRCVAAQAVGNLIYTDVTGIDALATARQLGALAAFACRQEDTRAKEEQEALEEELLRMARGPSYPGMGGGGYPGMGSGGGPGMPGGGMGMPGGGPGMPGGGMGMPGGGMGMPGSGPGMPGSGTGMGAPTGMPGGAGGMPGSGTGMGAMTGMPGGAAGGMPGMGDKGGSGGSMMGGGYPGYGGYPGMRSRTKPASDETDQLVERIRRRLKYPLNCTLIGVRGAEQKSVTPGAAAALGSIAKLAADDQQKEEIGKIITALGDIVKATDVHDEGVAKLLEEVRSATRELEKLLPNVAAADAKPTADEELPGGAAPAAKTPPAGAAAPADGKTPATNPGEPAGKN
jgi:hypothetical protein